MYLFIVKTSFVRFWADPPLLRLAFVAGLFAFIERGAQFELFAANRKRRAASPNLCFNHARGGFRGHCPNAGLVRCTWIFLFLVQMFGGGAVCEKTAHNTEAAAGVRLHRTLRGWGLHPRCTRLQPVAPSSQQNLGRPPRAAGSNRSRMDRMQRTRRTTRVGRSEPKTESRSLMHCKVCAVAPVTQIYKATLAT